MTQEPQHRGPRRSRAGEQDAKAELPASARVVAVRVLERVAERGAYASRALDAELGRARLQPRDAALATEIVYGALRVLPALDARIAARLRRPFDALDPWLRAALRAGCYQLLYLARVPAHAVVDESVGLVRALRGKELAGVANAVLRKLATERDTETDALPRLVVPAWLEAALRRALGEERARSLLRPDALSPPLGLRVGPDRSLQVVADALSGGHAQSGIEVRPGRLSSRCLLCHRASDPRALPGYAEGAFSVQEEGAQLVAACLGAQPGERVADLCAGHGGKTVVLAEAVGPGGEVTAVDVDERKLERIPKALARLGLPTQNVVLRPIDMCVGTGGLLPQFDRVLVDAPCTGLGTLRRRPELLLRVSQRDPARLARHQLAILSSALRLVRSGGLLLYAVCSPLPEEGAEVAAAFEAEHADAVKRWTSVPDVANVPLALDADGVLRLGPWLGGPDEGSPDAYQIVGWEIRGPNTV
ncbi:MAG: transcription antitermination factor NusB [Polyangiales bacterium]